MTDFETELLLTRQAKALEQIATSLADIAAVFSETAGQFDRCLQTVGKFGNGERKLAIRIEQGGER